jgi:hypothetical protein
MEGIVIDTDHWRHLYLIMAMIWGYAFSAQNTSKRRAALDGPRATEMARD